MPDTERRGWVHTLRGVLTEPMFVLLLAAAGLYLLLGDWGEGLLLSAFALLTVALVVVQGRRREHALQALRDLSVPWVRVNRDGQWQQCPATEVECGDWLMLSEGDRVAADGVLCRATDLRVDEAMLTGESWPVDKWPKAEVYAGTLVVAGHGVAEVTATGGRTRMGGIGRALSSIEQVPTPLQLQVRRLVRGFGALAAMAMVLVVLWWGTLQRDWVGGVLSALALGMLPEVFPMALAVFMSMGAWRLSRLQVLARRPAAIEALGTTTLLCVDKTGTLTENRLRLVQALLVLARAGLLTSAVFTPAPTPSIDQQRTWVMSTLLAGNLSLAALQLSEGWEGPDWRSTAAQVYGAASACALVFWLLALQWSPLSALLQLQPVPLQPLCTACALVVGMLALAQRWLLKR
jgi:Ca2+-transporting ATPase